MLIAGLRGQGVAARSAATVVNDPHRTFASSVFVRLEVLPKPLYFGRRAEIRFYEGFFDHVARWADPLEDVAALGQDLAAKYDSQAWMRCTSRLLS
ncbi:MAG: hypothetical protein U0531_16080 [Dehalococcoidia bacterium]